MLSEQAQYHANKRSSSPFEVLAVHIDTELDRRRLEGDQDANPANRLMKQYQENFPLLKFQCIHIGKALELKTVDWSALPDQGDLEDPPCDRLQRIFDKLPSMTARSDVLRLLIRHLLLQVAIENDYRALLFGHSTTALASLTLSEVANGRGFSVPWQINDGYATIRTFSGDASTTADTHSEFPVYYPMRELMKGEINTYISLVPALIELASDGKALGSGGGGTIGNNVVSHKDTSIDEVMTRYFESVEETYAGIVTNVVRTTGKLDRVRGHTLCGLCGVTLDEQGDSRWAGEIGEDGPDGGSGGHRGKLCYGCQRSVNG